MENREKYNDASDTLWNSDFKVVEIKSAIDNNIQKAFFYKSKSIRQRPLIVSLHTWSGDYTQDDQLSGLCRLKNLNYIHPDFRGANNTKNACCGELVISDIDGSITYAIENARIDTSLIYVIGVSGGGYATLAAFMKLKHHIKKFSAWASISDLVAFYYESIIRKNNYAQNVLDCTESKNGLLNEKIAREKSPIYWKTPVNKLINSEIKIYAGINDGVQGSVPITHSINFYNKLLSDLSVTDSSKYVSKTEKSRLLQFRKQLGNFGKISDRNICLKKEYNNIKLVIFEGNHEMLPEFALDELLEP